ncbi:hypothetical protein G6F36_015954 [Rhizopus arrhizus]|nr:hypothetical protein G6F36_015954 [Rhizopus arrhizus]
MVAIVDPPRPETAETVETCRKAGIRFFMVTGDFPATAAAIARQVGIFSTEHPHTIQDLDPTKPIEAVVPYEMTKQVDSIEDIETAHEKDRPHPGCKSLSVPMKKSSLPVRRPTRSFASSRNSKNVKTWWP